jgi:hypothetical protein
MRFVDLVEKCDFATAGAGPAVAGLNRQPACCARCPSVPSPHSKGGLVMALHLTVRGRIKTVAPVDADCAASPIACSTSGFLQGNEPGRYCYRRLARPISLTIASVHPYLDLYP